MQALTIAIVVIHVVVSFALIVLILLHAGRSGGLSDMFGGGMGPASSMGSTVVEKNLDRLTVTTAVIFAITTIVLTFIYGS
jgi:preprotein translocase subunit SecG